MKRKPIFTTYTALLLMFLYLPIFVLMLFSFNSAKGYIWQGFSFKWYIELFSNELILKSLKNTLIIAAIASVVSTVLGTGAALGVFSMRNKAVKDVIKNVTYIPMINPEIVTGISLMLLFAAARSLRSVGESVSSLESYIQIIVAHISFCVPSVFLSVLPKLRQINKNMYEAALDLGCNPTQAFFKVVVPEIVPGIISGFLMAVTYSIDDFVISYFNSGTVQTLPITIYSMTKKRISPEINALSTVMFIVVLALLLISNLRAIKKEKRLENKKKIRL